jgi:hypothetical protein
MKMYINGNYLDLQEGDEVETHEYPCDDCGSHSDLYVRRNGKEIAKIGDAIRIHERSTGGEMFGGVVLKKDGTPAALPITHLIDKLQPMTSDKMYYRTTCGRVLNEEQYQFADYITWTNKDLINRARPCPDCLKISGLVANS